MSYPLSTMIVFAVTLLNVTINLVCGVLLLWKRKEVPDRSRTILALPLLLAVVVFVNKMVQLTLHPDANITTEVLSPFIIFTTPIPQLMLLAYPVEMMRPRWMTWRRVLLILLPWLLLCAPVIMVGKDYFTPLYSTSDLLDHLSEWNVWWRLSVTFLIIFYAVLSTFLPYRWRESSVSRGWLHAYIAIFCAICLFLLSWMVTLHPVFQLCHTLTTLAMTVVFTWYELVERIYPSAESERRLADWATAHLHTTGLADANPSAAPDSSADSDELWQHIVQLLHNDDIWRNPELGLDMLCQLLATNKDYVSRCFRQHADTTFVDYVNNLRIQYVTEELRRNPMQSQRDLFFSAGFRSKTTGYRNFYKYAGMSPSEFVASLGISNSLAVSE